MSDVDDITTWAEGVATKLEDVYDPLDDVLRMRLALRQAVEALGSVKMPHNDKALASIRERLGIGSAEQRQRDEPPGWHGER